ncbi:30S ribosomal protein S20 [Tumebacillus sp. ITR2]|uniref:Small ribosomal subunit protein bS20 n=1 Tax=Tumebacillus amylolyticus TaxID=2801339 RepID=A0ABS1JDN4_9BACL|nr:30S ribosomal protein S20 [Tumebacillus amylolyticus]MBL0388392.1 30S ribosomal protein S20 [Tumebacillus amylolyticus]
MPNIKSAVKRVKTTSTRTLRNAAAKSALRTSIKKFEAAVAANDANSATLLKQATRALDKAVSKGLLHKNTASRKKSRLTKKFNQASA